MHILSGDPRFLFNIVVFKSFEKTQFCLFYGRVNSLSGLRAAPMGQVVTRLFLPFKNPLFHPESLIQYALLVALGSDYCNRAVLSFLQPTALHPHCRTGTLLSYLIG